MQDSQQLADDGPGGVCVRLQRAEGDSRTTGKKISPPSQTIKARYSSVRSKVFMEQEYKTRNARQRNWRQRNRETGSRGRRKLTYVWRRLRKLAVYVEKMAIFYIYVE